MPRWAKVSLLVLFVLVAGAAAAAAYVWSNLASVAAYAASKKLGREVTIGALHVTPGQWMAVDLHDLSIANLPGGTRPAMLTVPHITGDLSFWPLLHGTMLARSVRIEKGDLLLEKIGDQANWRNGPKPPPNPDGGRTHFPTILGGTQIEAAVTLITKSGKQLVTTLDGVTLDAAASDQPAHLSGPGSYRGVPITLDAQLGSYDQLHDASTKFPADITLESGDTKLHFVGTMTRPLQVDGADGQMSVAARTPAVLEQVIGTQPQPVPPLHIAGPFQHEGPLWTLQDGKGALGEAALEQGTLSLKEDAGEGGTREDQLALDLQFGHVNADRLLAGFREKGGNDSASGGFIPQAHQNPQISAKLAAAGLTYEKYKLAKPQLSLTLQPKELSVKAASFGMMGGQVQVSGHLRAADDGKTATLSATVNATGLDVAELRRTAGMEQLALEGRINLHAVADGTGTGPVAALSAGRGSMVATMRGGRVSEKMVEMASTDLTAFLHSSRAMVPLQCLLAAAEMRGGIASVGPVRLRSSDGTIVARGRIDLPRETLDVVVASESRTTGALALDIPIRVTGRMSSPSFSPTDAAAGRAALAGGSIGALAAPLRAYAEQSGCAG